MATATTAVPSDTRGATVLRLALVFLLGALSALLFSPLDLSPWWIQPAAFLVALLGAVALSDLQIKSGWRGLLLDMGALVALSGVFLWLRGMIAALGPAATAPLEDRAAAARLALIAAPLYPLLLGAALALVAQRRANGAAALSGGLLGWVGAAMAILIVTALGPQLNPTAQNPEPSTSLIIAAVLCVLGFFVAALGGLIGWGLRSLAARRAR